MSGVLYVVATPIGNLEDITIRAIKTLKEVALIAAEDTRTGRKLLAKYRIHTPLTSFHQHTSDRKLQGIVQFILEGKSVALISEAGTPGVSDPGAKLVRAALEKGIEVRCVPGPSAVTSCASVSGMNTNRFVFEGFLPRKKNKRRRLLEELKHDKRVIIIFEAPHRLIETLQDIGEILGDRTITLTHELTKLHESVSRASVSYFINMFKNADAIRGEFTMAIEPPHES